MVQMKTSSKVFLLTILFWGLMGSVAQAGFNAGFVNGLWYSKTPFFAGEEIRIYTVIQNQSGFDITGTVKFFSNDSLLGQSDFSIVNGRLIEKWADWKTTYGKHNVSVEISNTKKIEIGKEPEVINLEARTSITETYEVDLDTDGDGLGNKDDLDDDDDGLTDKEEEKNGTNPLIFDKPVVVEKVTESQTSEKKLETNGNKDTEDNTFIENVVGKSKELANIAKEKTIETVGNTKDFLEKQKDKVDEELAQSKKEETLKGVPEIDENRNPYVASILGSIPELKEVYSFVLAILIYIFNSWWILLGSILVLLYFMWKIVRKGFRRRY